ncbi:hypothetical protein PTNB73_08819 [Pyrenophora teres f. teres]|uniref:Uncharacterized protein n=1 Tax=Pyrenophora teres f. teres TaxID=97479 RepID=A0A6S6WFD9_9PLEO|nr:hypothetical protein PTNB85_10463 [Pyrenophora teres f. teres]CAA9966257.1 hypothetical protein PTMSG1_09616 [Pyrenophora teres f. maculata]KAE8823861.1 hypothetical protein HRS9139_09043 [Pyrenophora teres f. teres]KAE8825170.1 hypothetical protein HRS9122_10269 [Pyrenophora teres f. teres]KAE8854910.1 hypothetical protein PTNB29_09161 [Pyrenophora teres f. teres]
MDAPVEEADDDRCLGFGLGTCRKVEPPDELRLRMADSGDRKVESNGGGDRGENGSEFVDDVDEWDSVGVRASSATMTMG